MLYTKHGYAIPGTWGIEGKHPEAVEPCGGIHACGACHYDLTEWLSAVNKIKNPFDTRWENVFAYINTCVIDEDQWEYTIDYWDGDEFYSQILRVSKLEVEENPKWFGMLWTGMVERMKKSIKINEEI